MTIELSPERLQPPNIILTIPFEKIGSKAVLLAYENGDLDMISAEKARELFAIAIENDLRASDAA